MLEPRRRAVSKRLPEIFDNQIETRDYLKLILTSPELAYMLGVSKSTFYRHVKTGEFDIPYVTIAGRRCYVLETVKAWLHQRECHKGSTTKRSYKKWQ